MGDEELAQPDAPMDFYDEPVALDQAEAVRKANMYAGGVYETDPEEFGAFTATPGVQDDGRRTIRLYGRGRVKARGGQMVENFLGYTVSPDPRPKHDEEGNEIPGKHDLPTKLYANAVQVYCTTFKDTPKTLGAVVEMLQETPLRLRCMPGSSGPVVLEIQPARRRGK